LRESSQFSATSYSLMVSALLEPITTGRINSNKPLFAYLQEHMHVLTCLTE